jgi:hypothetical protein
MSWLKDLVPVAVLGVMAYLAYTMIIKPNTQAATAAAGAGTGAGTGTATGAGSATKPYYAGNTGAVNGGSNVGTGAAPIVPQFVTAGPTTPTNYFPGGNGVISTSRPLTLAEQSQVMYNLQNSIASQGITNAWWQTPTLTQTTEPGGINTAGSPQSNIPVGTQHCSCTAALRAAGVCGLNDDWYYC